MKPALKPIIFVVAALYFAVDEIFSSIARPIGNWLSRLRMLDRVRDWIGALRPYPALALFLVPLIVLEPVKPVATYLAATGFFAEGALVFVVGETLKLVLIERLFHLTRDKLMTIPAFAWRYRRLRVVLDWLEVLPAWRMTRAKIKSMKAFLREFVDQVFADHSAQSIQSEEQARLVDAAARRIPARRAQRYN
jgi:hypothetical protein